MNYNLYEGQSRYRFEVDDYPYIACRVYQAGKPLWKVYTNDNSHHRMETCATAYATLADAVQCTASMR